MSVIVHETRSESYRTLSPVLVIAYRRPDLTRKVFDAIGKVAPRRLYFFVDGSKEGDTSAARANEDVRALVTSVDWPCEVKTLFQESNLGCQKGVVAALSWFFENEESGIVLEDDCLPSTDFFEFCDEMLEKFRDTKSVGMICGTSPNRGVLLPHQSYSFSHFSHIWGWAGWRSRFSGFPELFEAGQDLQSPEGREVWPAMFTSRDVRFWKSRFQSEKLGLDDNWDSTWNRHLWSKRCVNVVPRVSLVKNIGFGRESTHAKKFPLIGGVPSEPEKLVAPYRHPQSVSVDPASDLFVERAIYGVLHPLARIVYAVLEMVRRFLARPEGSNYPRDVHYRTIAQLAWFARLRLWKPRTAAADIETIGELT